MRAPRFHDRRAAGAELAAEVERHLGDHREDRPDAIVLALPRGGVPVGYEIARRIGAPLDVVIVRKVCVPGHAELAMGAVASGDVEIVDEQVAAMMQVTPDAFDAEVEREREELDRRERMLRAGRSPLAVHARIAVVVDDGAATGATLAAAVEAVRARSPSRLVVAVPIAPVQIVRDLDASADEVVYLDSPDPGELAAACYEDFDQTTDAEVRALLDAARDDVADH